MNEIEAARKTRDEAFSEFVEESAKTNKHGLKARAARHRYIQASAEVRSLERDVLAYPVEVRLAK